MENKIEPSYNKENQPEIFFEVLEDFKKIYFTANTEKVAEIVSKLSEYPRMDKERIESLFKRELKLITEWRNKNKNDSMQITLPPFRIFIGLYDTDSFRYEKLKEVAEKLEVKNGDLFCQMMRNGYADNPQEAEKQWEEVKKAFKEVKK